MNIHDATAARSNDRPDRADVVVVGNCIAAMVAALESARRGLDVVLVNPVPNWGGHFSSKLVNGHWFDLGMVGFEFTGFHKHPTRDTALYDSRRRNDVARFCGLAQEYVEKIIPVNLASAPKMIWNDQIYPDVLMGNDLEVLKSLPPNLRSAIVSEVEAILSNPDRTKHASKKVDNPLFLEMSYEEASIANHGPTFHGVFIDPFAKRLFPGGAANFTAIYHRCLWMPLYYPETILAAMGPNPHDITTLFHYPAAGRIGILAETLLRQMKELPNVRIVSSAVSSLEVDRAYSLGLADGSALEADQLVWGLDLANLLRLCKVGDARLHEHKFQKTAATFGFFAVDRRRLAHQFSSLFVVDPKCFIYRISNLCDAGGTDEDVARLVMECSSHFFRDEERDNASMMRQISDELVQLGLVDDESAILTQEAYSIPSIMPVPNLGDHGIFWETYDFAREKLPGVKLVGPASGYLITTLNDQVVQGLKATNEVLV
jgi:hypothetical protein